MEVPHIGGWNTKGICFLSLFFLHSATSNSILDRAIDSEESQHNDFLRLVGHLLSLSSMIRKNLSNC